jgi:alkylation response protein AidB-like acyl-CoA dehydrogenase
VTDYRAPLADIDFVLNRVCGLDRILQLPGFIDADSSMVRDLLEEAARFMEDKVAPLNKVGDNFGVKLNADSTITTAPGFPAAYQAYVDAGWGAVPFESGYGGGGFPWMIGIAIQEMMTAANMAFSMCPLLTQGAIDALMYHGSEDQRMTYLPKMITGEWSGTMNLTEPDAGSDVGAVRTKAVKNVDGTYNITGTKIYISFGEHDMAENIIHLVLARTPDAPPGTKGISCFIVPKYLLNNDGSLGRHNDVKCVSVEHKLGIHASPTCVLSYGDNGGAIGYLIGEENRGMQYMFTMMNQARLSVGLQGLSLGDRAYQQSLQYAKDRRQGRAPGAPAGESSPIIDHPDVKRMLLTMKTTLEALRRMTYWNAACLDVAKHHPDAVERESASDLAALLTPMSKGWGTDMGVELTGIAVQIHGGMGFVEETGVAQHYRDARITTIYEGTNGIQAIDLVGRKLGLRGGEVVKRHLDSVETLCRKLDTHADLKAASEALRKTLAATRAATTWLAEHSGNPLDSLSGATPYMRLISTLTAGFLLADSAVIAQEAESEVGADCVAERIASARFFCEQLMPPVDGLLPAITGDSALLMSAI